MQRSPKQVVASFVLTSITTLLLFFLQHSLRRLTEGKPIMDFSLSGDKQVSHTAHEKKILESVVNASSIEEKLADIGGLSAIKADIRAQILLPLKHPKVFFGDVKSLHPPRGVLLHGPPGTGKTMLARAIAAEAGCPFIALTLSSLEDKWFGESSKLLAAAFSVAAKLQPCVLFIDEIDGFMRRRTESEHEATYGMKTEFLQHMDGIGSSKKDAFIVIACTNCVSALDPAIKRRLPQQFEIGYPDPAELMEILRVHLKDSGVDDDSLRMFASSLQGHISGSDVSELVKAAWAQSRRRLMESESFLEQLREGTINAAALEKAAGHMKLSTLLATARQKKMLAAAP